MKNAKIGVRQHSLTAIDARSRHSW